MQRMPASIFFYSLICWRFKGLVMSQVLCEVCIAYKKVSYTQRPIFTQLLTEIDNFAHFFRKLCIPMTKCLNRLHTQCSWKQWSLDASWCCVLHHNHAHIKPLSPTIHQFLVFTGYSDTQFSTAEKTEFSVWCIRGVFDQCNKALFIVCQRNPFDPLHYLYSK